jgi:predicted DNA-binding protein (MmcQ/YjbR family)
MANSASQNTRLTLVTNICLSLPEATSEFTGQHAGFLVRKKHFAYYLDNHHGDGIVGICCKVLPGDNVRLIDSDPKKFYLPAYLGPRGWVGLRLDHGEVDWEEVREILTHSYLQIAPKGLATLVGEKAKAAGQ